MTPDNDNFDPSHVFHLHQDVVCVDNGQPKDTTLPSELTVGAFYKIRWLGVYTQYVDGTYLGIKVEGINRGTCEIWGDVDPPFKAKRFRPVVHDPLASLKQIAADPDGYRPATEEGPRRNKKLPVREKTKVEVE